MIIRPVAALIHLLDVQVGKCLIRRDAQNLGTHQERPHLHARTRTSRQDVRTRVFP